jgi:hypothetical protein
MNRSRLEKHSDITAHEMAQQIAQSQVIEVAITFAINSILQIAYIICTYTCSKLKARKHRLKYNRRLVITAFVLFTSIALLSTVLLSLVRDHRLPGSMEYGSFLVWRECTLLSVTSTVVSSFLPRQSLLLTKIGYCCLISYYAGVM